MIFKIAKTELRNLFYSPVAWFLAIVFMIQGAIFYTSPLAMTANWQELLLKNNPRWRDWGEQSMTLGMFLGPDGIFMNVLQNLYLFVPLLTMGLISRETNNGTIKLLYSSPVKVREIVLGKFLAIMTYNAVLLLLVGVFMVSGAFNIRSVDYGMLLSAALGFYLMLCAYTAIGMFMSSLTTYQIVSAIATFVTIFILGRIGSLWQKYDFVRDLTYFLSLSGRTGKMLQGLITTKDVIYFIAVIYMFLGFTYLRLTGALAFIPWYRKALRYLAVIGSALLVGYVTSRPALVGYWDTTAAQINTVHARTQEIIKQLGKDRVEVTLYNNILGGGVTQGLPEGRNTYLSTLWEPYTRFKPDIDFKYVDYYDFDAEKNDSSMYKTFPHKSLKEIAGIIADGLGADLSRFGAGEELRKTIDLRPENYRLVMQLKYKGQTTFLRTFDDNKFWPAEQQVDAAFRRLIDGGSPKVRYITGHLERNINKSGEREFQLHSGYRENRYALVNQGFDVDTLSLEYQDIPSDVKILVLADPKTELEQPSLNKLRQYIENGGNMLILGEPGKQQTLNPLLQQIGVQLMEGNLVEITQNEMPHMVRPYMTPFGLEMAEEDDLIRCKKDGDSLKWLMPGVVGVSYTAGGPFTVNPVMMGVPQTWLKAGNLVTDSTPPVFTPAEGDRRGTFPAVLALTRKLGSRQQRVIVCGDADMLSNLRSGGASVGRALYSWLDENAFPIYTPRPDPADNKLTISAKGARALGIVYTWVLPALILLIGILLLIRRKRK